MALAQYWADPDKDKVSALFNGGASAVTVVVPGLPFALMPRTPAVVLGAILIVLFGIALTWLRKETGWAAAARTFGLLLCAAALSVGANVVPT
jgi:VIT1/CCC1 family predicted Fe2+/Mn2+ transporter